MKVRTVVAYPRADADESEMRMAASSVVLAGQECLAEPIDSAICKATDDEADYCHILFRRTVVLPSFYTALLTACEHGGVDYACCSCADLSTGKVIEQPTPELFVPGQILVKQWVLKELGLSNDPEERLTRVLTEYRGVYVPHVLAMEMSQ